MTPMRRSRRRLQAAALLAPVVIVQGASWFLGGTGPALAPAATPAAPIRLDAVLAPDPSPAPTPEQERCIAYLAALSPSAALRSPMAHDLPPPIPEPVQPAPIEVPALPDPDPEPAVTVPELRLTAILDNRSGGMAAIDGKIFRPGDVVAPGWRLSHIEPAEDRIVITSDGGRSAPIPLRRDLPR